MSDWLAYQLSRFISLSAFFLLPTPGTLLSKAEEPAAQFLPKKEGLGTPELHTFQEVKRQQCHRIRNCSRRGRKS